MPSRFSRRAAAALLAAMVILPAATFADLEVLDPVLNPIASGGSFDYGTTPAGTALTATFTVRNAATALGAVTLSGAAPTLPVGWSLTTGYGTVVLPPGASTTFTVSFDAFAPPVVQSGALDIASDDTLFPLYSFTLAGKAVPTTIMVDDSSDVSDGDFGPARLSLREAIELANLFPDTNTITFGGGVFHISPTAALPQITAPVHMDALGIGCSPSVFLDGTGAGAGVDGLVLRGGNSRVEGLSIGRFSGAGILVVSAGNQISCNQIGVKGGVAEPNGVGVRIGVSASGTRVGLPSRKNTISGNTAQGILIDAGGGPTTTLVQGNVIGMDATGVVAIPNGGAGVEVINDSAGTFIGADTSAAVDPAVRNYISGNAGPGIIIRGGSGIAVATNAIGLAVGVTTLASNTIGIQVLDSDGCRIGTNGDGVSDADEGNFISSGSAAGISISGPGGNHWIAGNIIGLDGTTTVGLSGGGTIGISVDNSPGVLIGTNNDGTNDFMERNAISGWGDTGIRVTGPLSTSVKISGNRIGTNLSATAAVPNGNNGIRLGSVGVDTMIGGPGGANANVIAGNGSHGILVAAAAQPGFIVNNFIGTDPAGTLDLGNGGAGIRIDASDWLIGLPGNTIANNGQDGIQVAAAASLVTITENAIHSNDGLGIDLADDGVTANDANDSDTGSNELQNYPTFDAIAPGATDVTGTLQSAALGTFTVEVFRDSAADPSGHGEGRTLIGSTSVTTNAGGSAIFTVTLPSTAVAGEYYAATATDSNGNTSEFSPAQLVSAAPNALALTRLDPSPTNAGTVRWAATFDSVVTGVDPSDFALVGIADAALTTVTEPYGTALRFDGVSGALTIPSFNGLPQTFLTVDAWIFPTQNKADNIVADHEWPAAGGWRLALDAAGVPSFGVTDGTTQAIAAAPALTLNRWYHVAGTYDGTMARIYVDATEGTAAPSAALLDNNGTVTISSPTSAFAGAIDEVHIWRRALDTAQLLQRRENLATGAEAHLVGNFGGDSFADLGVNADGADDIADASASANHADASGLVTRISWPRVAATTGTGDGAITAKLTDDGSITNGSGGSLAGVADGSISGESYTLDRTAPGLTIAAVVPDPRNAGVPTFTFSFTEPATNFTLGDISVTLGAGPNLIAGTESLTTLDNMTWTLSDLSTTTNAPGDYTIQVAAGAVTDQVGNPTTVAASESWHRNAPPTETAPLTITVAEDTPSATGDLFALFNDLEDADASLAFTVELNSNPTLATATSINATLGQLTITIAPNTVGTALITVRARDTMGLYTDSVVTLNVTGSNDAPTDIALAGDSISEAAAVGVPIGTFTTVDPDNPGAGQTFTYTLMAPGVPLAIAGDILTVNGPLDSLTNPYYDIVVRSTDSGAPPLFLEETFRVFILGAGTNHAPTDIMISPSPIQVAENTPLTTQAATLTTQDPDNPGAGQTFTYTIVTPGVPFAISADHLVVNGALDFEAQSTYTVRVRTTDNGAPALSFEEDLAVQILDVNEAPTAITLSDDILPEHSPNGFVVATLSTTDPDAGQSHSYSIAYDESGGALSIVGNQLVVANIARVDYEVDRHIELFIRTRDNGTPQMFHTQYVVVEVTNQNDGPNITRNLPMWVVRRTENTFNSSRLEIQDPDSGLGNIIIYLDSVPTQGRLLLGGVQLHPGDLFTQYDINQGFVKYVHDEVDPVLVDGFDFEFSDGFINGPGTQHFTLYVTYANTPPNLLLNLGATVPYQQESVIATTKLRQIDAEQSPYDLTYIVSGLPTKGEILRYGVPLLPGGFFTQKDLDDNQVVYRHTASVGGPDYMTFSYTDNILASTIGPQNFDIMIGTSTNTDPYLNTASTLQMDVVVGTSAPMPSQVFQVLDNEQAPRFRTIRVVAAPTQGRINLSSTSKSVVGIGGTFTQDDIDKGRISYVHDNVSLGTDSFLLQFDDGIAAPSTPVLVNVNFVTRLQDWKEF